MGLTDDDVTDGHSSTNGHATADGRRPLNNNNNNGVAPTGTVNPAYASRDDDDVKADAAETGNKTNQAAPLSSPRQRRPRGLEPGSTESGGVVLSARSLLSAANNHVQVSGGTPTLGSPALSRSLRGEAVFVFVS